MKFVRITQKTFKDFEKLYLEEYPKAKKSIIDQIKKDSIQKQSFLEIYILYNNKISVGFSIIAYSYSTMHAKKILVLDEIYVKKSDRRKGFARSMFEYIRSMAQKKKIPRIEWRTHPKNKIAREFYKKYHADTEWLYYQMNFRDV